jgi:hypothetical protein
MISANQRQQFIEQGYLTVQGLLDVRANIEPFREAYVGYLDRLADIFMGKTNPDLRADYSGQPFAERFATLLGCSGSSVLPHLDPSLSIFAPGYQRQKDLPSAQRPELFRLMRNERLLDALGDLLGPEIFVSPIYHFNLKLAVRQLKRARRAATAAGQNAHGRNPLWGFHVGTTSWHTDAAYGLPDAYRSRIINAWIPITPATAENGCLLVAPGSHRLKPLRGTIAESVIETAVPLPAAPGDVIFLDNNVLHASLPNRSAGDIRWAFSFRYLPTGEPTGRPFLPGFVARSHWAPGGELRDPQLWSDMWRAALDFLSMNPLPAAVGRELGVAEAEAITADWRAATPDYADWLRLEFVMGNRRMRHASI